MGEPILPTLTTNYQAVEDKTITTTEEGTTTTTTGLTSHGDSDWQPPKDPSSSPNQQQPQRQADHEGVGWYFTDVGEVREQSRDGSPYATDEVFNAASHLAATMLSLLGAVLLVSSASALGAPWKIVSFSVYGASLVFLFACSTLHHSVSGSVALEARLKLWDYLAIYPLIAGTFTPLCLIPFHNNNNANNNNNNNPTNNPSVIGWSFLAVVWFFAVGGMVVMWKFHHGNRQITVPKWMSMTTYLTLGWLGGLMSYWIWQAIGTRGMAVFLLGGILYTIGGVVYTTERPNPLPGTFGFHELWHIAVMCAAATHWCLMYFFLLPFGLEHEQ